MVALASVTVAIIAPVAITASRGSAGALSSQHNGLDQALFPLHDAVVSEEISVLEQALHSHRSAVETSNAQGQTPLMLAALRGDLRAVEFLVAAGASPDTRDRSGFSPVSYAVGAGHSETAHALLAAGADPMVDAHPGEPAAVFAARSGDLSLVTALTLPAHTSNILDQVLGVAVSSRHPEIAHFALDHGASILPTSGGERNALDEAVLSGQIDTALRILALHGPDIAGICSPGILAHAVAEQNDLLLTALLESGFDPEATGASGESALTLAITSDNDSATQILLEHCARPGLHLAHALARGNGVATDLLLAHGADPNAHLPGHEPPLFVALRSGNHALAGRLMELGADVTLPGKEGQGALATAIAAGDLDFARVLLEGGADPDSPLTAPASEEYVALIREGSLLRSLLRKDSRFTPLMVAAGSGQADVIRLLLDHGAKLNTTTKSWRRWPVNFAAAHGSIECQQLLLGYDPEEIPEEDQNHIVIDLSEQRAVFYKGGNVVRSSSVSTGKKGYRTKTGEFVISNKHRHWTSTLYDSSMPYFQRLSCSDFGMHVGYVPGYPASHGCIRMPEGNAKKFYANTRVGDRVTIRP